MATKEMTEEQAVNLLRNSLLVAGHEMGAAGDHWPVIKATVHDLMKDQENYRIEQNVMAEARHQYEGAIRELEALCETSPEAAKVEIRAAVKELRELCAATFEPVDNKNVYLNIEDLPPHLKTAKAIIDTLGGNDE
jgi:hypothetical protein